MVPVALLLIGCLDADLGDFDGFEEVGAAWGLAVERARGVCLFDADGDEDLDVLFTLGDGLSLHLNFAPGVFVDATESAGFDGDVGESPAGCGAADLDGDGAVKMAPADWVALHRYLRHEDAPLRDLAEAMKRTGQKLEQEALLVRWG